MRLRIAQMAGQMPRLRLLEQYGGGNRNRYQDAGDESSLSRRKKKAKSIINIESSPEPRVVTENAELNRVLGGGIVPGSLILVGGDPGIGKSTLLLQTSHALTRKGLKVLYISGEESVKQTKLRAERLNALSDLLYVLCETNLEHIEESIEDVQPDFIVIDSIQTVYHPAIASAPGSVSQVRECTGHFMRIAKIKGIATVLVGHVTKEGAIAGPRLLEHMVDCVLYFEGERHHTYRLLRAVKNRFGSTNEIGIFEMRESGLHEVGNPSELFLQERPLGVAGSTVIASIEGTRLCWWSCRRSCRRRIFQARAEWQRVLTRTVWLSLSQCSRRGSDFFLQNQDAYLNAAGGVKLDEPAVDLAIASASLQASGISPPALMTSSSGKSD